MSDSWEEHPNAWKEEIAFLVWFVLVICLTGGFLKLVQWLGAM